MEVNYIHKIQYDLWIGLRELIALNKYLTREEGLSPAKIQKIETYFEEKKITDFDKYYLELYKRLAKLFKDSRKYLYSVQRSDMGRLGTMIGYILIRLYTIQKSFESFAGGFMRKGVRFVQDHDFRIIENSWNGTGHTESSFVEVIDFFMENIEKYKVERGFENKKVEELLAQTHEIPIESLDDIVMFIEI